MRGFKLQKMETNRESHVCPRSKKVTDAKLKCSAIHLGRPRLGTKCWLEAEASQTQALPSDGQLAGPFCGGSPVGAPLNLERHAHGTVAAAALPAQESGGHTRVPKSSPFLLPVLLAMLGLGRPHPKAVLGREGNSPEPGGRLARAPCSAS